MCIVKTTMCLRALFHQTTFLRSIGGYSHLKVLHLLKYLLPWCLYNCWDSSAVVVGINSDAKMRSGRHCEQAQISEPEIGSGGKGKMEGQFRVTQGEIQNGRHTAVLSACPVHIIIPPAKNPSDVLAQIFPFFCYHKNCLPCTSVSGSKSYP